MIWAIAPTPMTPARNRSIANFSLSLTSDYIADSMPRQRGLLVQIPILPWLGFTGPAPEAGTGKLVASREGDSAFQLKDRADLTDQATVVVAQLRRMAFQNGVSGGGVEDAQLLQGGDRHRGVGAERAIHDPDGDAQPPLRHGQADEPLGPALGRDAAIAERHQVGDELAVPGNVFRVSNHRRPQPVERGGVLAPIADRNSLWGGERGVGGGERAHWSPECGKAAAIGAEDDFPDGHSHDLRH